MCVGLCVNRRAALAAVVPQIAPGAGTGCRIGNGKPRPACKGKAGALIMGGSWAACRWRFSAGKACAAGAGGTVDALPVVPVGRWPPADYADRAGSADRSRRERGGRSTSCASCDRSRLLWPVTPPALPACPQGRLWGPVRGFAPGRVFIFPRCLKAQTRAVPRAVFRGGPPSLRRFCRSRRARCAGYRIGNGKPRPARKGNGCGPLNNIMLPPPASKQAARLYKYL